MAKTDFNKASREVFEGSHKDYKDYLDTIRAEHSAGIAERIKNKDKPLGRSPAQARSFNASKNYAVLFFDSPQEALGECSDAVKNWVDRDRARAQERNPDFAWDHKMMTTNAPGEGGVSLTVVGFAPESYSERVQDGETIVDLKLQVQMDFAFELLSEAAQDKAQAAAADMGRPPLKKGDYLQVPMEMWHSDAQAYTLEEGQDPKTRKFRSKTELVAAAGPVSDAMAEDWIRNNGKGDAQALRSAGVPMEKGKVIARGRIGRGETLISMLEDGDPAKRKQALKEAKGSIHGLETTAGSGSGLGVKAAQLNTNLARECSDRTSFIVDNNVRNAKNTKTTTASCRVTGEGEMNKDLQAKNFTISGLNMPKVTKVYPVGHARRRNGTNERVFDARKVRLGVAMSDDRAKIQPTRDAASIG